MGKLLQGRLLRVVAASALLYAVASWSIPAPHLILILNGLLLSVGSGIAVAYAPIIGTALVNAMPSKGEYLIVGIFFSWLSVFGYRGLSIVGRDFGHPEVFNSTPTTFLFSMSLMSGMLHLWAPNAVMGRLPRKRWVTTGIVVALGLFVVFVVWTMHRGVELHPSIQLR